MGWGVTSRRLAAGATAAALMVVGGCGASSDSSPPAGVDGLVIPTPTPDPGDFVSTIDNPWLPYAVGAAWTYVVGGTGPVVEVVVSVAPGRVIAGVTTVQVTTAGNAGDPAAVDYYAQDRDGNVWWFGRDGVWEAGSGGAEAGIAMLARPRVGDGYREMDVGDTGGQRSEIIALDGEVEVPANSYTDVLVIETTAPGGGGVVRNHYARGTGLVLRDDASDRDLQLVGQQPG